MIFPCPLLLPLLFLKNCFLSFLNDVDFKFFPASALVCRSHFLAFSIYFLKNRRCLILLHLSTSPSLICPPLSICLSLALSLLSFFYVRFCLPTQFSSFYLPVLILVWCPRCNFFPLFPYRIALLKDSLPTYIFSFLCLLKIVFHLYLAPSLCNFSVYVFI